MYKNPGSCRGFLFKLIPLTMKNVIITGAGKGIGFALANKFLEEGHRVIAISRNIEALKKIKPDHGELHAVSADITNTTQVVENILAIITSVDVLVNNAGAFLKKPFEQISIQEMEMVYKTNVFAPLKLIGELKKHFVSGAHIVNIGSMGGVPGAMKFPGLSVYSSSKGALGILTECLQTELKEQNVAINCLAIGAVSTEMQQKAFPDYVPEVNSKQMAQYIFSYAIHANAVQMGQMVPLTKTNP